MPWATNPACCCAPGRAAKSRPFPSFTPTKCGPELNTRWLPTSFTKDFVDEGLTIVKALRSRYDGRVRNPWDEYECGNWYARAMSSFALVGALSGFRYSAVDRVLHFAPRLSVRPFISFFSTASGYGAITVEDKNISVRIIEGELKIDALEFTDTKGVRSIEWKTVVRPDAPATRAL